MEFKHGKREAPWGQYSILFCDPDGHLIEVGESMGAMVERFIRQGMTPQQVSERTGLPTAEVEGLLAQAK